VRRMFGPAMQEVEEGWTKQSSAGGRFRSCYDVQIRKDEKGGACHRHGRAVEGRECIRWKILRHSLGRPGCMGKFNVKSILEKFQPLRT